MANHDGPKWPSPVTFDDNRPKEGFVKIHLKMPELKVSGNVFTGYKIKNGDMKISIKQDHVVVEVNINDGPKYLYDKQMPEDIKTGKSKHEQPRVGYQGEWLVRNSDVFFSIHSSQELTKDAFVYEIKIINPVIFETKGKGGQSRTNTAETKRHQLGRSRQLSH